MSSFTTSRLALLAAKCPHVIPFYKYIDAIPMWIEYSSMHQFAIRRSTQKRTEMIKKREHRHGCWTAHAVRSGDELRSIFYEHLHDVRVIVLGGKEKWRSVELQPGSKEAQSTDSRTRVGHELSNYLSLLQMMSHECMP